MALKFLNKKGWHTGSLRNIENVWKAEQKHEAEQRKLEELRKQIHEERERAEFRQLQEQAGLISKQDRLDFLYDSGLAVGKGGSSFKALESLPKNDAEAGASASSSSAAAKQQQQQSATPGALFEDKPQSANDSWRKLHSDPLLLIRQKEQEALARVKNNPVQMAMIRKSVEMKAKDKDEKRHRKEHRRKKSKRKHSASGSDSEDASVKADKQRNNHHKVSKSDKNSRKAAQLSGDESSDGDHRRKKYDMDKQRESHQRGSKPDKKSHTRARNSDEDLSDGDERRKRYHADKRRESRHRDSNSDDSSRKLAQYSDEELSDRDERRRKHHDNEYKDQRHSGHPDPKYDRSDSEHYRNKNYNTPRSSERDSESHHDRPSHFNSSDKPPRLESNQRRRGPIKLSEEERAARLREMQMDAEKHEEQRWKRLKTAAANDAEEAIRDKALSGRNFLDAAHKSVYGAEKGGSSTVEESVRRRTHYLQGRSASESNAFRR